MDLRDDPHGRAAVVTLTDPVAQEPSLLAILVPLLEHWKLIVFGALIIGAAAVGSTFLIKPTFTAATTILPPQQQSSALSALTTSLGPLAALAGAGGVRTPTDQYLSFLQSVTVADRIIDEFKLLQVYDEEFRIDARKELERNLHVRAGKKDGLITIEFDDKDPKRAAAVANQLVDELRRMTGTIAVSEAQQRRVFFEGQLQQTRDRLTQAQQALGASGFNQGALKAEPKAAAEGYARLRAEVTAAEVRLQTLRRALNDNAPEVQQQQAALVALRAQLARVEAAADLSSANPDYISKYREFKYQETLFELFARQYELARVDESREGALIQVVDTATVPEKKSAPKRAVIGAVAAVVGALLLAVFVSAREALRRSAGNPLAAAYVARLNAALGRRS